VASAIDFGSLPRPSPGVLVGGEIALRPLAVALDTATFLPVEREVLSGAGLFFLSTFALRPCLSLSSPLVRVDGCAAAEAHLLHSRGRKVDRPADGFTWVPRFGLAGTAAYRVTRALRLSLGGALLGAPARPTFLIDGRTFVHRPAALVGRLTLGFELWP
jgi:hypothetical protein